MSCLCRSLLPASRDAVRRIGLAAIVVGAVLLGGCTMVPTEPPAEPVYASAADRAKAQVAILEQAWEYVDRKFYNPEFNGADWATAFDRYKDRAAAAPTNEALYEVINEMLGELEDAHTIALTPWETWEDYVAERAFVGVNLERVEDEWVVGELRPGSAAEEAGVKVGWVAIARDDEPLTEDGITFVSEPGQSYKWTFVDDQNNLRQVMLEARTLSDRMPPVERHSAEGWVYLRFDEFSVDYDDWLEERLRVHHDAPGIVLDLRSNSGGEVASLKRVINQFFIKRTTFGTFVSRKGRRDEERTAWRGGADYEGELVVLIGAGSASSAEILAHVMQYYGRATLIGRTTAGVVVASLTHRLADGGELQLGTWDYRTLDGGRLEGHGVEPDVVVERSLADMRAGRDPDLAAAVEWLRAMAQVKQARQ